MEHIVLLLQSDAAESSAVLHAFANAAPGVRLFTANDPADGYDYLCGAARYANRTEFPQPQFVLLDIDTTRDSGLEMLRRLRREREHSGIPIICITAGSDNSLVTRAYEAGASACVLTPSDEYSLREIANAIADFAAVLTARRSPALAPHTCSN